MSGGNLFGALKANVWDQTANLRKTTQSSANCIHNDGITNTTELLPYGSDFCLGISNMPF